MLDAVIAGLLATVIGGLILYFGFGVGKSTPQSSNISKIKKSSVNVSGDNNTVGSVVTNVYNQTFNKPIATHAKPKITQPSPRAIYDEIKSRPLLQQESARNAYIDQEIIWKLRLFSIQEYKEIYNVSCLPDDDTHLFPDVECDVKKADYPQLKIMHRDATFFLEGKIAKITSNAIRIKDARIIFSS